MIVEELKKSFLQQAFEGKLSVTSVKDTATSDSLKKILKQKEELINNNKIKKESIYLDVSDEEKLFKIPNTWKWLRIGQLGVFKKGPFGSALTKGIFVKESDDAVKVYEQKNAIQKDIELGDYYITKEYFEEKMKSFEVHTGDIIVSCAGTIGETYIIPKNHKQGIINQALMKMTMVNELNIDYFLLYFDFILKRISNKLSSGSAIKNIPPFEVFKQLVIPIPPIEEQGRIVKVLQDIFYKLDSITPIEEELFFLKTNFSNNMVKSILEYAYSGNLTNNIIPFDKWNDKELIKIADIYTGNSISESIKKKKYINLSEGYNYIATKDLNFDHSFNYENGVKIPFEEKGFKYAEPNDILMCIEGGSAGKKIGILSEKVCFGNKLCKFSLISEDVLPKYLYYYLQSPVFLRNFYDNLSGIIGGVSINKIKKIHMKYPSIKEQIIIVDLIEKLLPLCSDINDIVNN